MISVKDIYNFDLMSVAPQKVGELEWFSQLGVTFKPPHFYISCPCGDSLYSYESAVNWIPVHYEHREVTTISIIEWLENYENN